MKYKDYSKDIWLRIEQATESALALASDSDPHPIAAFDADGTLWDTDLGETFFQYQIDNHLVPLPPEPLEHYHQLKKKNNDPREAYLWLAQISQGVPIDTVRKWAQSSLNAHQPVPVFSEQKKLIEYLLSKKVEIFIVTASIKWAVEPAASLFGLNFEHVLGIETESVNDILTDKQKGIITYRQGKVDALLHRTKGKKPFLTAGNTMGDFRLLSAATHLALAVSAASRDDELFKTEFELQQQAAEKGWISHRFV